MSLPEMTPVSSSNIESIGYDESNQQVYIRFLNGSLYTYVSVPIHEFESLRDSPSIGSYLNRSFKNVFPYERIE
jgi:hypothetical protein